LRASIIAGTRGPSLAGPGYCRRCPDDRHYPLRRPHPHPAGVHQLRASRPCRFLAGYSGLTSEAYTLDLRQFIAWSGQLNWTSRKNPAPGVVDTPCVGVQWKKGTKYPYEMYVVDNTLMPNVRLTGTLEPTHA
jgi:hypothetical protein